MTKSIRKRLENLEDRLVRTQGLEISAYQRLLVNPYLKEKQRVLGYQVLRLARSVAPLGDGRVHLSAADIANDYRKKPESGDSWDERNPDGSVPLAQRGSVKGILSTLIDSDALDVEIGECHREHENGSLYRDSDFIVRPLEWSGYVEALGRLADFQRDKSRAPYGTKVTA